MPEIEITEFIPPMGQTRQITLEVPEKIFKKWEAIKALGLRITTETLSTGEVNVCIEEPRLGDFDLFVAPNKADTVTKLLCSMIEHFNEQDFTHWKMMVSDDQD